MPRRVRREKRDPMYKYLHATLGSIDPNVAFALMMEEDYEEMYSFMTEQMSAKAGLRVFGKAGAQAIMKELEQLLYCKVMRGRSADTLTPQQKKAALKYLIFLKEKRCGRIKGRGCADSPKQRLYKTKEETSSPTVSIESLMLSCVIDAKEGRNVFTCDIPGAFMQVDMDEQVFLKLEGDIALLLIRLDDAY